MASLLIHRESSNFIDQIVMLSKDVAYLRTFLLFNNFSGFERNRADAMATNHKISNDPDPLDIVRSDFINFT